VPFRAIWRQRRYAPLACGRHLDPAGRDSDRRVAGPLLAIGALTERPDGGYALVHYDLVADRAVVPAAFRRLIGALPGVVAGLAVIKEDPQADPDSVGRAVKAGMQAGWGRERPP
jgi:hypothetical protein